MDDRRSMKTRSSCSTPKIESHSPLEKSRPRSAHLPDAPHPPTPNNRPRKHAGTPLLQRRPGCHECRLLAPVSPVSDMMTSGFTSVGRPVRSQHAGALWRRATSVERPVSPSTAGALMATSGAPVPDGCAKPSGIPGRSERSRPSRNGTRPSHREALRPLRMGHQPSRHQDRPSPTAT